MRLAVNNQVIQRLKEEFPTLSKPTFEKSNCDQPLKMYFNNYENDYKYIVSLENLKNDESIHDYEFFNKLLNICNIILNNEDYDIYLKQLFNDNYELINVNTTIPNRKYDLKTQETILGLKIILLAVKSGYKLDTNNIYTPNDIILMQNQNVIRYLNDCDIYAEICGNDFLKLNREYKSSKLVPMRIKVINSVNYLNLLNNYPHLFSFIRNNISFEMISEFLLEYEELFSSVINKEIDDCNKMICKSLKRIDDIKKYN